MGGDDYGCTGNRPGHQELFDVFISHRRALIEAAVRIVKSRESAEDVVQDTFVKLFERKTPLQPRYPVSYLFRSVRNLAIDRHRRSAMMGCHIDHDEAGLLVINEAESLEGTIQARQELDVVRKALATLPERTRWAFEIYRFRGIQQKDIAAMLNVSPTLVNFMIKDAMKCCRDALFRSVPIAQDIATDQVRTAADKP